MPSIEYDVDGYIIEVISNDELDPNDQSFRTLVARIIEFNNQLGLSTLDYNLQSGDEYKLEFQSSDGRKGEQTVIVEPEDAILTWVIEDEFRESEIKIYPNLRNTIIRLTRRYDVTSVTVDY